VPATPFRGALPLNSAGIGAPIRVQPVARRRRPRRPLAGSGPLRDPHLHPSETLEPDPPPPSARLRCDALQIIDNLELGGAQRLLSTLAGQYRHPSGLVVLSLTGGEAPFGAILQAAGAQVAVLPGLKLWNPMSLPRLVRALRARAEPVVHIHLTYATILGAPAARLAGKRVVVSLHNALTVAGNSLRAKVLRWLETLCLRHFTDRVIFVGTNVARTNRDRIGRTPGIVVQNVIAAPEPLDAMDRAAIRSGLGASAAEIVVIATGRLSAQKDPVMLIRAFAAAHVRQGRLRLWVVGDGPLRADCEALAVTLFPAAAPKERPVQFLGPRDDVQRLLPAADIFALSSQWEGLPVALLEAMAAGKGIVCTRVGDIPEFLPDSAALIVEPGRTDDFADALTRLAEDPALRVKLAKHVWDAAQPHCDVAGWRKTLETIYAELT
jgi:glycosyltransferase involved in cell wall biosynthesis